MNFFHPLAICACIGFASVLGSCARYKSSPVDLAHEEAGWKQQTNSIQSSRTLRFAQARQIGLVLNPDLNKARLKLAGSKDVVKQSGWWNDPSFSWDIARVIQQDEKTLNFAGGLAFTIPVTGLPALEKQVAEYYKEADYWTLRQAELDFLTSLEQRWNEWGVSRRKLDLTQMRLSQLKSEDKAFSALSKMGEIDFASLQIATQRLNSAIAEAQSIAEAELEQRQAIIKLLGMHPSAAGSFNLVPPSMENIPGAVSVPGPAQLTHSPRVLSKLAAYSGSEVLLKAEIRRQYPDLELGPVFSRDDGEKELGGSIGFNIPLWNRNRKGVAEAQGTRNSDRLDTVQLWRGLLQEASQARAEQKMLLDHTRASLQRVSDFSGNLSKLERLHGIGETSLSDLAEARHQVYESKLTFLDVLNKLMQVQAQIRYFTSSSLINK